MQVKFTYLNHRGITRERTIEVECLEFMDNPGFGYQPGWFLTGLDTEKMLRRSFALTHIKLNEKATHINSGKIRLSLPLKVL